ncbi:MAG: hypothetical protein LBU62_03250 [Bacteroidales bacterium]|jgi:hypothetical protein|nr:hypothetical protein [Bacteroidales bacterium]
MAKTNNQTNTAPAETVETVPAGTGAEGTAPGAQVENSAEQETGESGQTAPTGSDQPDGGKQGTEVDTETEGEGTEPKGDENEDQVIDNDVAKEIFARSDADILYFTADGQAFLEHELAWQHACRLDKKNIVSVTRENE